MPVDITIGNTPVWYGGDKGVVQNQIERSRDLGALPYEKYMKERIAPFSPLQNQAFQNAETYSSPEPRYGTAGETIENALNRNIYGNEVSPYLQRGTTAPGAEEVGQFFNPYQQQVVENIGRMGSRNLLENILPRIQDRFIASGQYGSTGHQNLTNRAIRDTQEGISNAQANALQGGYNTALQAALGQQEKQLQAGQLAGTAAGRDVERQLLGSEALQNLAGAEQLYGLRGAGVLSQLGAQQQQQVQNAHNIAHQEFIEEKNHPYKQLQYEHEIARGLPVNSQVYSQSIQPTPPPLPQASPYTQAGGLLAGFTGMAGQRQGYAHGGEVKKLSHHRHYAEGGSLSPIQQGANAAIDTAELKSMRDQAQSLARPQGDPFWASIARAGFNIAANRQPGVLAKLGEAGNAGLSEYQSQLDNQEKRGLASAKIMNMIENTRRLQADKDRIHELRKEQFAEKNRQFGLRHGVEKAKLGLLQEKLSKENKSPIRKSVKDQKDVEEAKKQWEAIQKSAPEVNSILHKLEKANEKVKTPGWEAAIGDVSPYVGNTIKNIRTGKTNVNDLDVLAKRLANIKIAQLTGKQSTVAHQKAIMETKANPNYTYETNKKTIALDKEEAPRIQGESDFGLRMLEKYKDPETGQYTITPGIIKLAYNNFWKEKEAWDIKNPGKKFPYSPEKFLDMELGNETPDSSSMELGEGHTESEDVDLDDELNESDDELMKIAGIQ